MQKFQHLLGFHHATSINSSRLGALRFSDLIFQAKRLTKFVFRLKTENQNNMVDKKAVLTKKKVKTICLTKSVLSK